MWLFFWPHSCQSCVDHSKLICLTTLNVVNILLVGFCSLFCPSISAAIGKWIAAIVAFEHGNMHLYEWLLYYNNGMKHLQSILKFTWQHTICPNLMWFFTYPEIGFATHSHQIDGRNYVSTSLNVQLFRIFFLCEPMRRHNVTRREKKVKLI